MGAFATQILSTGSKAATQATGNSQISVPSPKASKLRLGLVTYNLARDWDVPTIIQNCTATGYEAVELRTTHAHQVEVTLNATQRREIKQRFADSIVKLASLGSAFEYHAIDPAGVRRNINGTFEYIKLAHAVGAAGVKIRPNGLQVEHGIPVEKTLEQIGLAFRECAQFARDYGVEIRVETHGEGTSRIPNMKKIFDYAAVDNLFYCWNSNQVDLEDGGLVENFNLVQKKIHFVHLRDLYLEEYPWQQLFRLLIDSGYQGYCCAEIQPSTDPLRVMRYFRALFLALQDVI
jgi:sugar phosphate isomerase/epimerase